MAEKCFGSENSPYLKETVTKTVTVFLTEKQKKQIPVVLSTLKADEIKNRKFFGKEYIKNDYVFKLENGEPYRPNYISKKHKQILEKYGFKHIRFHDLRHSCASLLNAQGFTIKDIQEWLGHSDIQTTANTYAHLDIKRKQGISNTLSNVLYT